MLKQTLFLFIGLLLVSPFVTAEEYTLGPDSERHAGVPKGKITKYEWTTSKIYPGTVRDYWVYVPPQYSPRQPARTMVFQDGVTFVNETGAFRTPIVFDNSMGKPLVRPVRLEEV